MILPNDYQEIPLSQRKEFATIIRSITSNKDEILKIVDDFLDQQLPDMVDKEVYNGTRIITEGNIKHNIEITFRYAESEIERIFLNAVNLACLFLDPTLLFFVPPSNSIEDDLAGFRRELEEMSQLWEDFNEEAKQTSSKEFYDWLGQLSMISIEDRTYYQSRFLAYFEGLLSTTFHVCLQPTFRSFRVNGKHIRADMLIWLPFKHDFNLVVECDGYQYHSSKSSFANDRARDRILYDNGYQVLRFAGTEIYNEPVIKSIELVKSLMKRRPSRDEIL